MKFETFKGCGQKNKKVYLVKITDIVVEGEDTDDYINMYITKDFDMTDVFLSWKPPFENKFSKLNDFKKCKKLCTIIKSVFTDGNNEYGDIKDVPKYFVDGDLDPTMGEYIWENMELFLNEFKKFIGEC